MTMIELTSPLNGWATRLSEVPDPVFAERMLGDGVAIDPVGEMLHAPCDGVVIGLHDGGHSVTLRTAEGAEVLMHIGIDTVALGGEGFTPRVAVNDVVRRGDGLIAFDLDGLLPEVPAVITPIVITNSDRFIIVSRNVDRQVAVGAPLLTLEPRAASAEAAVASGSETRQAVTVPLRHGLHARPAARIAECARGFDATIALHNADRRANARSAVSMMGLGAKLGDTIDVAASGPDADAAIAAIRALIESGMGEAAEVPTRSVTPLAPPSPTAPRPLQPVDGKIAGVTASPGRAVGTVRWLRAGDRSVDQQGAGPASERTRLEQAIRTVADRMRDTQGAGAGVLAAHRALLEDPDLHEAADREIAAGRSAGWAWRAALRAQSAALRGLGDARIAERADDLLDIERQVLAALAGEAAESFAFAPDTILLADDLLPSQLLRIGAGGIAGFATARGGPTSHVAIIAAGMGIPGLVAAGAALQVLTDNATVILDADAGVIETAPTPERLEKIRSATASETRRQQKALAHAAEPAVTRDGVAIEVFANLGSQRDAQSVVQLGAEGCGLLRTEFLFLERDTPPDEAEQAAEYQAIADALEGRPLIVRLLDIGGDKPAPYLPIPAEENPALGLRGIRVGLARRDLLSAQLRAILRVRPLGQCRIMVPMIASVAELLEVRAELDAAARSLGLTHKVELGVMIETPAAAVTADLIAEHADFLSIGTNDLTQYVLAMDRGNPAVAGGIDGLHPAVLRMIALTCEGGRGHARWTGVCGGLASDPLAVPILIGLGVSELSATPASVPAVKAAVRAVSAAACRALAQEALTLSSATDVRALARRFQSEHAA